MEGDTAFSGSKKTEYIGQMNLLSLLIFKPKLLISPDANGGFGLTLRTYLQPNLDVRAKCRIFRHHYILGLNTSCNMRISNFSNIKGIVEQLPNPETLLFLHNPGINRFSTILMISFIQKSSQMKEFICASCEFLHQQTSIFGYGIFSRVFMFHTRKIAGSQYRSEIDKS